MLTPLSRTSKKKSGIIIRIDNNMKNLPSYNECVRYIDIQVDVPNVAGIHLSDVNVWLLVIVGDQTRVSRVTYDELCHRAIPIPKGIGSSSMITRDFLILNNFTRPNYILVFTPPTKMALPGFEKLPLECALDDPPQLRTLVTVFSSDVAAQHEYLGTMHRLTSKLVASLDDVTLAYQGLAHHMHAYSNKVYAINTDPKGLIDTSLSKCAELMQEVSTWQHILCTQLTDGVLHPLTQQLNAFSQLQQLKEKHQQSSHLLDSAMSGFLRVKKKDSEAEKQQAALTLTDSRRNFHQCSVLYYNEMNLHQAGRQLSFLTPLLALVAAHQCFHSLAHAALNANHNKRQVQLLKEVMQSREEQHRLKSKEEEEKLPESPNNEDNGMSREEEKHEKEPMERSASKKSSLSEQCSSTPHSPTSAESSKNKSKYQQAPVRIPKRQDEDYFEALGLVVKRLESEHERESTTCSDLLSALLDHSEQLYSPSTSATVHAHQAHTHGLHGYLNVNRKFMAGVMSTWERVYVFVECGHLMAVGRSEVAGSPLLTLEPETLCHAADTDDRLHVFTVVTAKKSVTLQALTNAERDIWITGLEKAGREGGYIKGTGSSSPMLPSPSGSNATGGGGSTTPSSAATLLGSTTATGFLSSMGQFLSSKLQSVNLSSSSSSSTSGPAGLPTYSCPKPSKLSPLKEKDTRREFGGGGAISSNAPIVFDLGPLQGGGASEPTTPTKVSTHEGQTFDAAFLGSMPVNVATGAATVISEVIRRVMSARAHHNLFSSTPVVLRVASPYLTITARHDTEPGYFRQRHRLTALTGWCTHRENPRLFGYVVRGVSSLQCFVFQCDEDASRICRAITIADDPHAREKEKSLILANIAQLEDDPHGGRSSDPMGRPSKGGRGSGDGDMLDEEKVLEEFDTLTEEQIAEMEAEMGEQEFDHLME